MLLLFPAAFLLPFITGLLYKESISFLAMVYLIPAVLSLSLGALFTRWGRWKPKIGLDLRPHEALVVVSLSWLLIAIIGSFPFMISGAIPHFVDAFFESMSGFTTTGASVITEIDPLPRSVLLWRAMTQWLGGLGVIVLMVALFSMLFGGPRAGMMLMKGEVPGHSSTKIVHRIKDTAKIFWTIYLAFTLAEITLLTLLGLSLYDSVCHTFTTLSTGGYSTHTASISYYADLPTAPLIELVIVFFMLLGSINFVLHYLLIKKGPKSYLKDVELRVYFLILLAFWCIVAVDLAWNKVYSPIDSVRASIFTVTSIQTTTGYATEDFGSWPALSQFILLVAMFGGGMTGSTGGAMKIARFIIVYKTIRRTLRGIGHPRSKIPVKVGGIILSDRIVRSVGMFMFGYIAIFMIGILLMSLTGLDAISSISAVAATLGNVGPGLNLVGPTHNYASISYAGKIILSMLMWIGRLELITVLILFSPSTYKY